MISYELAKKLRDAGFPRLTGSGGFLVLGTEKEIPRVMEPGQGLVLRPEGEIWPIPSLSELIDACGDNFWSLGRQIKGEKVMWVAHSYYDKNNRPTISVAQTPEKAVANLWFALNKK